jgi:acyl carrier protein
VTYNREVAPALTADEILDRVRRIVAEISGAQRTPPGAGAHTPLGEDGFWLDSIDFLEIVVACQEVFGTEFDPESDLTADNLRTVGSLAAMIAAKLRV